MPLENSRGTTGSLVEVLDHSAQAGKGFLKQWSPGKDAIPYSYASIRDASQRLALFFRQRDIQPHDRVILWGPNSPDWVTAYSGVLRAGAVVVPFDATGETDFFDKVVAATSPSLIIAGEAQAKKLTSNYHVPVLGMEKVNKMHEQTHDLTGVDIFSGDLAEIIFTSGTTGNPKGVMLTHGNIRSNVESVRKVVPLSPNHRLLSILPLSHMFETTVGLLTPMVGGASVSYIGTRRPDWIMQAMIDEQITCMAVVPDALELFRNSIEKQVAKGGIKQQWPFYLMNRVSPYLPWEMRRFIFGSLHKKMGGSFEFFVSGGAPLNPRLARAWENFGIRVIQGYGMTEASPVVSCDSLSDQDPYFVGRPIPGVEVRIAPDGEILVRGPNIMAGYWNNPEATNEVLDSEGWYKTDDLGDFSNGRLRVLGRKSDVIILPNGKNVYPNDVQQAIVNQGRDVLKEAMVFYREVKGRGELHAVLLLREPKDAQRDFRALIKTANQGLELHQKVGGYTVWEGDDFPRTNTLKAKRREIINAIL